jgi:hypothetical protein
MKNGKVTNLGNGKGKNCLEIENPCTELDFLSWEQHFRVIPSQVDMPGSMQEISAKR